MQAALRSRADQVTLGPGAEDAAWEQTVTRNGRAGGRAPGGRPGRKPKRWAAPLAAAATIAVIGAGIGIAATTAPGRTGSGSAQPYSATVVSGAPGLTGPDAAMLRSSRPNHTGCVGEAGIRRLDFLDLRVVRQRKLAVEQREIPGRVHQRVHLQRSGVPRQVFRGCDPEALGTGMLSPFGDMVGESAGFDQFGLALRQVTSVTMQSESDESEKIPASLIDGRGFPYKVFVVAFPAGTNVENWKLVAREADGKQDVVPFPVAHF